MSYLNFSILAFSTNFCRIESDLSGNTVWPQISDLKNSSKLDHLWHFWWTFVHSKCKRSSLRSQWWTIKYLLVQSLRASWFFNECLFPDDFLLKWRIHATPFCKVCAVLLHIVLISGPQPKSSLIELRSEVNFTPAFVFNPHTSHHQNGVKRLNV